MVSNLQVMTKGRCLTTATVCLAVLIVFLHVTLIYVTDATRSRGLKDWTLTIKRAFPTFQSKCTRPATCDRSHESYDLCSINGPALLDPSISTFFSLDPTNSTPPSFLMKTKPYPRKTDKNAMSNIKELSLTSAPPNTSCGVTHNNPALVFSAGGYTGNFFHEFNDGLIPLFITVNSIFPNQDIILVITNCRNWWTQKYTKLLHHFTPHPIINMDNEITTHCFPSAIVGLISHGPMNVDPTLLPNQKTLFDFHAFLGNAYNQGTSNAPLSHQLSTKPRLVLVNRKGRSIGRRFLNLEEIKKASEEAGFHVIVFEPTRNTTLVDSYELIHSSHAMLGVHGAALTHMFFLRPASVFVQVVPIATEWVSETCFGKPARDVGLEYMEYKIRPEESSLAEKYDTNDLVLKNPRAIVRGNWTNMRLYMKTQNVKLKMVRFQKVLKKAYKKAKEFMDKES